MKDTMDNWEDDDLPPPDSEMLESENVKNEGRQQDLGADLGVKVVREVRND